MDVKEVQKKSGFANKVIKSRKYVIVIIQFYSYPGCYEAFYNSGLEVMIHSDNITRNPDSIHTKSKPQEFWS